MIYCHMIYALQLLTSFVFKPNNKFANLMFLYKTFEKFNSKLKKSFKRNFHTVHKRGRNKAWTELRLQTKCVYNKSSPSGHRPSCNS